MYYYIFKGLPSFVKKLENAPNVSRKIKKHVASMSHLLGSDSEDEEDEEGCGEKDVTGESIFHHTLIQQFFGFILFFVPSFEYIR